jgi:hypothetical protein
VDLVTMGMVNATKMAFKGMVRGADTCRAKRLPQSLPCSKGCAMCLPCACHKYRQCDMWVPCTPQVQYSIN